MELLRAAAIAVFTFLVVLATLPVFTGLYQFVLVAVSMFKTHLEHAGRDLPRVSILIPAWNEDAVVATTIERLMSLDYPSDRLRIYVIDDGSTDETPHIVIEKTKCYPNNVIHIRRVAGGEGKAHTLNYGLDTLWKSEWTQAVLIMDADVIYTRDSLRQMARHLTDPSIGAVTAYIKEGSASPNLIQRFITFEYITATGASRRAQNVLGFLACLSGGAQLHSRENLLDIGGKIFDDTLAEDTFTTFRTQLKGRQAIFEPNAIVYAEEPCDLDMLWKQRLRWARGNVQITLVFRKLWFNKRAHPTLGSSSMAALWFSIFLMPVFQITATTGLLVLYVIDKDLSWTLFRIFWISAAVVYLQVTLTSFVVDAESAAKSWAEGFLFPGLLSLSVIVFSLVPAIGEGLVQLLELDPKGWVSISAVLVLYSWNSLSMLVAWSAKEIEKKGWQRTSSLLLLIAGYGPFLCAVTFASYIKEWQGEARTWDKTVKTGKVG